MTFIKVTRETDSDNEEHLSIGSLLCLLYLYSLVLCSANVLPLLRDIKYEENPTNRRFDKHRLGRKYFWSNPSFLSLTLLKSGSYLIYWFAGVKSRTLCIF